MPVPQQPGTPTAPGPAPADWSVLSRWRPDVVSTLSATIGRACGEGTALQQAVVEIALPPGEPGRWVPGNRHGSVIYDVFRLLAAGISNSEIAQELGGVRAGCQIPRRRTPHELAVRT